MVCYTGSKTILFSIFFASKLYSMLEAILMQTKFFLHLHYVANKILEVSTSYCLGSNLADQ
jgi:hypothetical protein